MNEDINQQSQFYITAEKVQIILLRQQTEKFEECHLKAKTAIGTLTIHSGPSHCFFFLDKKLK